MSAPDYAHSAIDSATAGSVCEARKNALCFLLRGIVSEHVAFGWRGCHRPPRTATGALAEISIRAR